MVLAEKGRGDEPHSERPLTASVTAEYLGDDVTPTSRHFIRNNLFTPDFDESKHTVEVGGLVDRPMKLTVAELRSKFPGVSTQAMLECAGSGRTGYNPAPRGTPWPVTGGMSCSRWTGVRLADVLRAAGVAPGAVHVAFTGADFGALPDDPESRAQRSARQGDGAPHPDRVRHERRPAAQGARLSDAGRRSVVGGLGLDQMGRAHRGARCAAQGPDMDESYRIPRYPVEPGGKMPPDALMTEAWPVKSIITHPAPNARFAPGQAVLLAGKAWAGENDIARVELSFDEGRTWQRADLNAPGDKYAWRTFSYAYTPRRSGYTTVLSRATDDAGNMQPLAAAWNPLGYFWNGWHRTSFVVGA